MKNSIIKSALLALVMLTLFYPSRVAATQTDITGPTGSSTLGNTVRVLPNGNIVVTDPSYNIPSGATAVGAVYLYDGTTLALISTLTGSTANDQIGSGGVTVLTNGNYVVSSANWDNPSPAIVNVGAATWCSATTGCSGVVSAANSLVGSTASDNVSGNNTIVALTNGNYVVRSTVWDNPSPAIVNVGAVTWGNGTTGTVGTVSAVNSLVGSTASDQIGGSVTALTNGNYVVGSALWDNPSPLITDVGAVTWGSGTTGISGAVSAANSLIGSTASDAVGSAVTALPNGNYVVRTQVWDNPSPVAADAGAVTWGNGAGGTVGLVTSANSLVGSTATDNVGNGGVTALTNGNYVVLSTTWDNPSPAVANVGAVTWGSGTTGISGLITSANSLVGGTASDQVGSGAVTALTNGNYVVLNTTWDNPSPVAADAGAVTWGNGAGGTVGLVTSANSLIGSTASDQVGSGGVTALTNGNYVVLSQFWDNPSPAVANIGAVTWGSGTTGISGLITSANSLVGGTATDNVGNGALTALTNGNYVVRSPNWDSPSPVIANATAYTFGSGAGGTSGLISNGATGGNSVVGTVANGTTFFAFDATRNRLFVGRNQSNAVSILFFNTTAVADGSIGSAAIFDNGLPGALFNAIIPNGRTVSLSGISNIGQVSVDCTANLTGADAANYIVGSVRRNFCAASGASFVYPIGDPNNYSPLTASNVSGTGNLTVTVTQQPLPGLPAAQAISRVWSLDGAGITTDLTFQYTAGDVSGTEATFKVNRRLGTNNVAYPTTVDSAAHTAKVTGITDFSPWGIGNSPAALGPTAAGVSISGRVKTADGRGVMNAVVVLTTVDGQTVTARTSSFGLFRFAEVPAGQTVVISVQAKRYVFAPQVLSLTADEGNLELIAVK